MSFELKGVYAPIPTPFVDGEIAYDKLERNLEYWLDSKLEGLVVLGSNGEFVLLSSEEKIQLIKFVCQKAKGRKSVIAGTGAESTAETIFSSQQAAAVGADAVLVVTPNYYKGAMSDKALIRFYLDVAEASTAPVILYNMPGNTGINLSPKVVAELAQHPNIIGIKDSGGNIVQITEVIRNTPSDFSVFAGSASFLYASLALGAKGGTLALANVFPNECAEVQALFEAGKWEESKALQLKLMESNTAVTARFGIAGLKAALDMLGYFGGDPRLPLLPIGGVEKADLKEILKRTQFVANIN
ncbi:4-hydroxy-tetrahydrodipicolinate synthase [Desulfosporosinus shakirovi]|uniref:4-hydroxy-tetrahydrodipicolinate synthase n=1 Tax=Desulfosporosinus shakirovi TaxID=2885154 RepID=UPI001E579B3F|nr:4-hydroxy-tetrahydrodipicolinate synthase [Desulfosporosinus sp. SRJS8]MCB8815162.1 4-hydroxy-tetrahydrodipicolinate synthase [Desulfosporosinus sp. SRJS8]